MLSPLAALACAVLAPHAVAQPCSPGPVGGGVDGPVTLNGRIFALGTHAIAGQCEALYAGGSFDTAGGQPASFIARWDGSAWSALGAGIAGEVWALGSFDDGAGVALYAGGTFGAAGGQPASRIARWDGADWSPLAGGLNQRVEAIVPFDDGTGEALYAAGWFTQADGQPAPYIARWDGSSWSDVGGGVDDWIRTLIVFDDGTGPALYAGGRFLNAGGSPASRVARWDGVQWTPLGSGPSGGGEVNEFAIYDDGSGPALHAVGSFGVERWDGANWVALPVPPLGSTPFATVVLQRGNDSLLFVGGSSLSPATRLAYWDGIQWTNVIGLDGGASGPGVYDLAVFDDGDANAPAVYAGGIFETVSGEESNGIARIACEPPGPCPGDLDGDGDVDSDDLGILLSNFGNTCN